MKLSQKLVIAAGVTLGCAATQVARADAAVINFEVNINSGALAGQTASGTFSYDDSSLTGVGDEFAQVQSLSFNFLGKTYSEKNDVDSPAFPVVSFFNGQLEGLNYYVELSPVGEFFFSDIVEESFLDEFRGGDKFTYTNAGGGSGLISYQSARSVPEPLTLSGTIFASGLALLMKKKEAAKKAKASSAVS
ncbi:PEP-CTERM sorting domain-containing protein [Scytonema sp. UIC 10036]|uniref:PEP-CTERM sorting domain-containing protein n=1 Tax=Scytonema sp. UIC 10036 TaxID=2304196 RepID=UPI0012DA3471|nr:PEP-CTERM sorting domain-containing protein [Scytonema sp. UIC 10036]MUH01240.1 PEP-CTERM sorting domain-containing protein [Scytonema sp. UIC 10036]